MRKRERIQPAEELLDEEHLQDFRCIVSLLRGSMNRYWDECMRIYQQSLRLKQTELAGKLQEKWPFEHAMVVLLRKLHQQRQWHDGLVQLEEVPLQVYALLHQRVQPKNDVLEGYSPGVR
eukprot:TRINITY_DN15915_c0_g1_i1.p3 TRINITY_DN15915_c0_g1~~TRINITY_DN15915_c0_g1_i1.p3  ORF type:complete len:120 (+),score=32.49 TRINITY_DN15915_c0_g1_i1:795-1154(+)